MKIYKLNFNPNGVDPRTYTGLGPTFISFYNSASGATLSPPGITEIFTGSGDYRFQYDVGMTSSVFYTVDGGATLNASVRFLGGILDPLDKVDQALGYTGSSFGDTSFIGSDVFGVVKRIANFNEGQQTFIKSSGTWNVFSKGSSTLLVTKTLTNSTTGVTAL